MSNNISEPTSENSDEQLFAEFVRNRIEDDSMIDVPGGGSESEVLHIDPGVSLLPINGIRYESYLSDESENPEGLRRYSSVCFLIGSVAGQAADIELIITLEQVDDEQAKFTLSDSAAFDYFSVTPDFALQVVKNIEDFEKFSGTKPVSGNGSSATTLANSEPYDVIPKVVPDEAV